MANIKLHELSSLNLSGTELFNDSESFMTELSEENQDMANIVGGHKKKRGKGCECTHAPTFEIKDSDIYCFITFK